MQKSEEEVENTGFKSDLICDAELYVIEKIGVNFAHVLFLAHLGVRPEHLKLRATSIMVASHNYGVVLDSGPNGTAATD